MNELELILTDTLNCSRANLYLNSNSILLKDKDCRRLDKIFKNRARQIPLQYALGYAEFMGLRFKLSKDVLIPRPETEILVEAAIEKVKNLKNIRILDIGTGSGCIAISLVKLLKNCDIAAVDISKEAIKLAKENSRLHNTEERILFLEGDFFDLVKNKLNSSDKKFDIIVSNPPYVPTSEIGMFDKTTLCEPKMALDGGRDGLNFYRRLEKKIDKLLKKDGFLIIELGYGQSENIKEIFSGNWIIDQFKKDYQGIERICVIKRKKNG
ncbi:MAG: peptide chain release factor N(5)-glutamine methyltransferase [Candidatus Omnitrophica bacterium]|nr:peptide chain release factor N(5)-glutamine methyltransferase [Candidatus Omnitrophota bacterium]